jgi:hypothetical protein
MLGCGGGGGNKPCLLDIWPNFHISNETHSYVPVLPVYICFICLFLSPLSVPVQPVHSFPACLFLSSLAVPVQPVYSCLLCLFLSSLSVSVQPVNSCPAFVFLSNLSVLIQPVRSCPTCPFLSSLSVHVQLICSCPGCLFMSSWCSWCPAVLFVSYVSCPVCSFFPFCLLLTCHFFSSYRLVLSFGSSICLSLPVFQFRSVRFLFQHLSLLPALLVCFLSCWSVLVLPFHRHLPFLNCVVGSLMSTLIVSVVPFLPVDLASRLPSVPCVPSTRCPFGAVFVLPASVSV